MLKVFCSIGSNGCPNKNWFDFCRNDAFGRTIKDCPPFLPNHGLKPELITPDSCNPRSLHYEQQPLNRLSGLSESINFVKIESIAPRPVLFDIQGSHLTHPSSLLLSFGIAEQCKRQEKMLQLLVPGSNNSAEIGLDLSSLSNVIGIQPYTDNMQQQLLPVTPFEYGSSLLYPSGEFHFQEPLLDFVGDLARDSKIMVHPDGQVSFTGIGTQMKDLLSIVAEFYLSKKSTYLRKQTVVPYFNRPKRREARAASSINLKTVEASPSKRSENLKHKQSSKKNINKTKTKTKTVKERDVYEKNSFHACETLLSLMINKGHNTEASLLLIKKSGPELPEFLTQLSAGIAGTGIAVLFSVMFKLGYGKVPFCASNALNVGFGFGLVWLSWAVNRLRDTVTSINKSFVKLDLKEEELIRTLDSSVDEIFVRAATVFVMVLMRFACV